MKDISEKKDLIYKKKIEENTKTNNISKVTKYIEKRKILNGGFVCNDVADRSLNGIFPYFEEPIINFIRGIISFLMKRRYNEIPEANQRLSIRNMIRVLNLKSEKAPFNLHEIDDYFKKPTIYFLIETFCNKAPINIVKYMYTIPFDVILYICINLIKTMSKDTKRIYTYTIITNTIINKTNWDDNTWEYDLEKYHIIDRFAAHNGFNDHSRINTILDELQMNNLANRFLGTRIIHSYLHILDEIQVTDIDAPIIAKIGSNLFVKNLINLTNYRSKLNHNLSVCLEKILNFNRHSIFQSGAPGRLYNNPYLLTDIAIKQKKVQYRRNPPDQYSETFRFPLFHIGPLKAISIADQTDISYKIFPNDANIPGGSFLDG